MVQLPFPVVLILAGALFWPWTLCIAVVFALVGALVPRTWVRVVCFGIAALLAADCVLAIWVN